MNKIESIWIINDDDVFTFIIKKNISKLNICNQVCTFQNGEEAMNSLISNSNSIPDIILLDINMPVMDGWDFLNSFESMNFKKNIAIYLTSAHTSDEDNLKASNNSMITGILSDATSTDTLLQITSNLTLN